MKGNIGNMMKQAQQLQANMQRAQAEIATARSDGRGGRRHGEGRHDRQARSAPRTLDPSIVSSDDKDMLEDLIAAADQRRRAESRAHHAGEDVQPDGRHEPAAGHEDAVLNAPA